MKKNIIKIGLLVAWLLIAYASFAQEGITESLKNLKARSIGPAGMSGRVTSIDVLRNDPDQIIIGAASGGVWMSKSGGVEWEPIFDKEEIQNIGAVAFQQSNPSVIWVGTGEGNPRNSQSSGAGIYKSIDGGRNWTFLGLKETKTIHRILIDPVNPNTVYVASLGSAWGPNVWRGVYKTTDGGMNWKRILYVNDTTGCADLVMDPSNPNKLIAAMWQYERKPWTFKSGGKGSGIYVTYDGGENWKRKGEHSGLPKSELGRVGLAIAPSKPNIVYALVESKKTALYRSTDGGENWKLVSAENIGNRPFYYADIFVDTKNENRLYNLYSLVSQSDDGGKNFRVIMPYSGVHPDHHALYIHPDNPNYMLNGNDGGLNISRDGGKSWRFVENLPLGQFYHINIDNELPYNIYGGMQDNGSWVGPAYKWQSGGLRNSDWEELLFGDGFDVVPYLPNTQYGYAMYQGGNVYRYDRKGGKNSYIQPVQDSVPLRFNWNAAIAQDPFNEKGIYFGSQFVHKSEDMGNNWKVISPDLTTNDTAKQKQALSGGLTIDATRAENYTAIISIEPSSLNKDLIWVGSDDGRLHKTSDGGKTWTDVSAALKGLPKGVWIPQIHASKHDENRVFVVANDYRRNNWKTYLYRSDDGGKSFKNIARDNVKGYALSVIEDSKVPNLIFLGTEQGLWVSFDAGKSWERWKHGVPAASVMDMKVQEREKDLVLGTFGRAAFVLDDIEALRSIAKAGKGLLDSNLVLFDPPTAYVHANLPARGVRFTADAHYRAQNKWSVAMITAYIKEGQAKPKADAKKPGKRALEMKIYDSSNKLIRTRKFRADTGIQRLYWGLREDGSRMPTHGKVKEDQDLPGGDLVAAGKYKIVLSYKDFKDSAMIDVKYDPNWGFDEVKYKATKKVTDQVNALVDTAFNDFERLKKLEAEMGKFRSNFMAEMDSTQKKELNTRLDSMSKEIASIKKKFMTPKDFKGYDHVSEFLNSHLNRARSLASESEGEVNSRLEKAIKLAEEGVNDVHELTADFIRLKWNPFVEEINALDLKPLKKF